MWYYYLTASLRSLRKQPVYASINLAGLALGIACCILMLAFVQHEWLHDRFHEHADRIFRVVSPDTDSGDDSGWNASGPGPFGPALRDEIPDVLSMTRVGGGGAWHLRHGEQVVERTVHYADPSFFDVFTFTLAEGDPATALGQPNGVVVSRQVSQQLFGAEPPVGRAIDITLLDSTISFTVTGVLDRVPSTSSLRPEVLLPIQAAKYGSSPFFRDMMFTSWELPHVETWLLLRSGESAPGVEKQFPDFIKRRYPAESAPTELRLQALTDIHLDASVDSRITAASNPRYSAILLAIAVVVLLVACINFVTLAVARADVRAREVGIRKVVGAKQGDIRVQFWFDALLTSLAAVVLGVCVAQIALPVFSEITGTELGLILVDPAVAIAALGAMTIAVGFLAGSYPALLLSRMSPVAVLKGFAGPARYGRVIRSLVVVQFSFSIALLIGTMLMARQLDYLRLTDLGFDREQIVALRVPYGESNAGQRLYEEMRGRLRSERAIDEMTSSFFVFGEQGFGVDLERADTVFARANMEVVDLNFVDFMGLEVIGGRTFSESRGDDRSGSAVLINQALADLLGEDEVVGMTLPTRFYQGMTVAGVVKDYHYRALHHAIGPQIISPRTAMGDGVRTILVRLRPGSIGEGLGLLESAWNESVADAPFTYAFLDDVVNRQYASEARWGRLVRYAATFALIIACFGLFGLSTLAVARRVREIGIRKVLGATVAGVVILVSKDLVRLVGYAFVLAAPIGYLAVGRWLDGFAYRIDVSWRTFALAALIALVIAVATVSIQAFRAATANPVDALRHE